MREWTLNELKASWVLALSKENLPFRDFHDLQAGGLTLYPASVPGAFELDLQAAGIIKDPFFGLNAAELSRWDHHHIWYACRFHAPEYNEGEAWLRFKGIDCYADIYLNGEKIGESDNALIEHEFDVQNQLRKGDNDLVVHIRPTLPEATRFSYPPSVAALRCNYESLYIRKAPHCFGWDIMPRILSAGLWRPVSLVVKPLSRIEDTFLRTVKVDASGAHLILHYDLCLKTSDIVYDIEIEGSCGSSRFMERSRVLFDVGRITFKLDQSKLWWPRGRGRQDLYDISVRLLGDGKELDRRTWKHGIRTVELDRTSTTDSDGKGRFCFRVNGEPLFVMGTNWVPVDAFHSRDAERMPRVLELAEECGCNLIRCWGGNVYESDEFFDLCDRKGFLVWQDFAFACAVYPQDEDFQRRVAIEARQVVRRLRRHACLALWAGDNECDQFYSVFSSGDPNTNIITREVLPKIVHSEDPGREYLPSSPYIDPEAYKAGQDFLPENHLWGPRDNFKSAYYKNALCHFASEIGYHGCPSPDSVRRFLSKECLWPPNNKEWLFHATSPVTGVDIYDYRIELMQKQIREFFGECPDNLDDFASQSQCVQAEALKFFIEWFRSAKWRRTGIIWWNLCDGWPQFSDAVVDYYFSRKMAFDFITRVQSPLCLVMREPANGQHELVACNDTRDKHEIEYKVTDIDSGELLKSGRAEATPDAVTVMAALPASTNRQTFLLIEWSAGKLHGKNHYLTGQPPYRPEVYQKWLQKGFQP